MHLIRLVWNAASKSNAATLVASSTGSVEDATDPVFNSFESLRIDLDVAFHMHRIDLRYLQKIQTVIFRTQFSSFRTNFGLRFRTLRWNIANANLSLQNTN